MQKRTPEELQKLKAERAAARVWTLEEGLQLVRQLKPLLGEVGYSLGLTGGTLYTGVSKKDLDLIIFPRSTAHQNIPGVYETLQEFGMYCTLNEAEIKAQWQKLGSIDTKWVECWRMGKSLHSKRVDLFFLT